MNFIYRLFKSAVALTSKAHDLSVYINTKQPRSIKEIEDLAQDYLYK